MGRPLAGIFISYERQSQATAEHVADRLTAAGYEVWWDEQIPAHRAYAEVIEERLCATPPASSCSGRRRR